MASTRTRDPSAYVSNDLTGYAWTALADVQAAARKGRLNPSKSAVLLAMATVAEAHMDEILATLEGPE